MGNNEKKLFKELTPPAGGLEKFRIRLEKESGRPRMRFPFMIPAAVSALLCLVLLILIYKHAGDGKDFYQALYQLEIEYYPTMIRLGLADPPEEPVTIPVNQRNRIAVQRVAVADPQVIYYRLDVIDSMNEEGESDF